MSDERPARARYFNKSGPCHPDEHYMLPPEPRLPDARELIDQGRYFVVHAPRQVGKTTTLAALARDLTAEGRYVALRFSCETAKIYPDDVGAAEGLVLDSVSRAARSLPQELQPPQPWPAAEPGSRIVEGLSAWASRCPLPVVLFFDEIDALLGQSLISVLSQLRDGNTARPDSPFPWSVVLVGLRDVRDYRIASGANPGRLGTTSPFNVAVESMRIANFTEDQVAELYAQHTADTGQEFTSEGVDRAFEYSQGQPWLTNAIAYEITSKMRIKPPEPITAAHVDEAKERLILSRATHLDYLATRLTEPRVRGVIGPLLAGSFPVDADPVFDDDVSYVRDLGLIAETDPVRVANPIYKEVIVRALAAGAQRVVTAEPRSFLLPDGRLDMGKLLGEFAAFWRRNGEILVKGEAYHEVAPQLVFMAFLQRVVNGGGLIDREYGIGRGRIDLLVRKPYAGADGEPAVQEEALELKVRRRGDGNPLNEGLAQLDDYLDRLALDAGVLVIFDRRPSVIRKRPNPQISRVSSPSGRDITLLLA